MSSLPIHLCVENERAIVRAVMMALGEAFLFALWLFHPLLPRGASTRPRMAALRASKRSRSSRRTRFDLDTNIFILDRKIISFREAGRNIRKERRSLVGSIA